MRFIEDARSVLSATWGIGPLRRFLTETQRTMSAGWDWDSGLAGPGSIIASIIEISRGGHAIVAFGGANRKNTRSWPLSWARLYMINDKSRPIHWYCSSPFQCDWLTGKLLWMNSDFVFGVPPDTIARLSAPPLPVLQLTKINERKCCSHDNK